MMSETPPEEGTNTTAAADVVLDTTTSNGDTGDVGDVGGRVSDDDDDLQKQEEEEEDSTGTRTGCCYRCCISIGCRCCTRIPETWPRSFALCVGVVLPLFILIAVSCVFGYCLARLEAPGEIEGNDAVIAARAGVALGTSFVSNLTRRLPHICLTVYFSRNGLGEYALNDTLKNMTGGGNTTLTTSIGCESTVQANNDYLECLELDKAIDLIFVRQYVDRIIDVDPGEDIFPFDEIDLVNTTDLLYHMDGCGKNALRQLSQYDISQVVDTSLVGEGVSFNWVRCDGSDNATGFKGFTNWLNLNRNDSLLKPDAQESLVVEQWRQQQRELYKQYFDQFYNGTNRLDARWKALTYSFEDATGHDGCDMNWYAGAWFWFTIMTTIGYGNTAPVTDGARAMVFTLGFLSILLFGTVLAKAGSIVTTIADDASDRLKLTNLNRPVVGTLFWAVLYYTWMCVIASYTVYWKDENLDEDMPYKDAYWFSFISTTTVGFGDFFLEHEVITSRDLIIWPLLFLAGFVLLSSFLNKLSELIMSWFPQNRPTLEENLENTDVPCFPKLPKTFVLNKKKKRKEQMMSTIVRQDRQFLSTIVRQDRQFLNVEEDDMEEEEFINESTPVEAKGLDGNEWKGAVTYSHSAPQDAA